MSRISKRSILSSLKGKIWFAVSGLAVINCVAGVGVYLLSSYFLVDSLFSTFLSVVVSAFITMVFGWWLANDVLEPLTRLTLAAKSLERSPTASLPRTTGSLETDELLDSINRTSVQIQELIAAMELVSAGRISSLNYGTRNSDRLNITFHNMIAKIADSVNARSDLNELEKGVADISSRLMHLRDGDLSIELRTDLESARGLADGVNFLVSQLRGLSALIVENSQTTTAAVQSLRDSLRRVINDDDAKAGRTRMLLGTLSEMPGRIERLSAGMGDAFGPVDSIVAASEDRKAFLVSLQNDLTIMRKRLSDVLRRIEFLRDRSSVLEASAREATDVSRRSNMLAINVSMLHAGPESTSSLPTVANEIETISQKASDIAKDSVDAGAAFARDLNGLEELIGLIRSDLTMIADRVNTDTEQHSQMTDGLTKLFEWRDSLPSLLPGFGSEHQASLSFLAQSAGSVGGLLRSAEESVSVIERSSLALSESTAAFRQVGSQSGHPHAPMSEPEVSNGLFHSNDGHDSEMALLQD